MPRDRSDRILKPVRIHATTRTGVALRCLAAVVAIIVATVNSAATQERAFGLVGPAHDVNAIVGPGECAECHKKTAQIWKLTLHHGIIKTTHRSKEGKAIAKRMGIKRIKDPEGLCAACHYTVQLKRKKRAKVVAGVSCESCHGASRSWIKAHSEYSGKKKETESAEEMRARWVRSEAAGMIRPRNLYDMAKNCYSCHGTAHEELVNVSGHPTGDQFELLSWTMGEVRHNVWYTPQNNEALPPRKRMLYLAGAALSLETALKALSEARKSDSRYAREMRARAVAAKSKLNEAAGLLTSVPALQAMIAAARPKATAIDELKASGEAVAKQARRLLGREGNSIEALDTLLPRPEDYVGKATNP